MNRQLVGLGSVLALLGAIVLAITLFRSPDPAEPASTSRGVTQTVDPPSRVWAIGAGGLIAAGAALIGIGVNRWKRERA